MVSEEKLMMNLLRDYYICKLYVKTSISSRNISNLTGVSVAVAKRALHLIEERKEDCLRLLPLAFQKAVSDGVLFEVETIDEAHLNCLQAEVEMTTLELQVKNRWASSSAEAGSRFIKNVKDINNKYCSSKRDVSLTKNQVKKLIDSGSSFQEAANKLGISKTTAYNFYHSSDMNEMTYEKENHARKR